MRPHCHLLPCPVHVEIRPQQVQCFKIARRGRCNIHNIEPHLFYCNTATQTVVVTSRREIIPVRDLSQDQNTIRTDRQTNHKSCISYVRIDLLTLLILHRLPITNINIGLAEKKVFKMLSGN